MRRALAIVLRQAYLLRSNPTRFALIFYWALIDLVLWGVITLYLDSLGERGFSFITAILGAVILWNFFIRVQQGISVTFLDDIWSRNFLNIFASPMKIGEYVLGMSLTSLATSFLSLSAMVVVAWLTFSYSLFQYGLYLAPFVALLFFFGVIMGVFATALILRFGTSAEWLAWTLPSLFTPLAGIYYPVSALPAFLQGIAKFLPPAYVFEGMRAVILEKAFHLSDFIIAFILTIFYFLLAYGFLIRIYRMVLRRGILARFNAEIA